ncbi:phosphate-starvation-inducible PsiE family protein [Halomicronema sp. CCY15110]|uniref:phosphate-starvation-inducible PsiE family protein n=1 Tax=Halomicronema sp. CCY15110 TaxID=2767773 RepID=UPI001EF29EB1|nr:phosphate-starvation-inducible PsiE family protein [Halomicronema sp. CCY15110]
MNHPSSSPLPWYRWLNSSHVIRVLETVQDLIVVCLCIGLFSFMVLQLREMVLSLLPPLQFQTVTSDILFLLILVEVFRLLIIYLQEHRVSIGVAVEVSIVSVLREIIVRGVLETPWIQVLVACIFLMVLGALLVVRVWLPPTFDGVDPEQVMSQRHRSRLPDPDHNVPPARSKEVEDMAIFRAANPDF